jgi:tetratricopeptide (TPR) repeat protein
MLSLLVTLLSVAPVLPAPAPLEPSRLTVAGARRAPSASVEDVKTCGACHRDIAAQWRTSAHALASFNNPLYRVSVERLRRERGTRESRMCAGCHDLALLTSGAMDAPEIVPEDERAHAGVSCSVCHSVVHAERDGNGSATLRGDRALPSRGEDTSLEAHRKRVASITLRTAELCATCHRAFLDTDTGNAAAFFGMDDYGAWLQSAWAGSAGERPDHVEARDCRGCHMAREPAVLGDVAAKDGGVPSHRFLGAHTLLGAMRKDPEAVARTAKFLENSVTVDVAAVRPTSGAVELDVVVFNDLVGHRFPGGVLDNQGTRVELEVRDATGQLVASSSEHQLRAAVVDANGHELHERETHEFVAAVWNHTVPARDARVVRFHVDVPKGAALPLRYEARVVHVARLEELVQRACEESKTPRGQAFAQASQRLVGQSLDPCVAQPRTVVATSGAPIAEWLRAYRHGLGLSVGLQEYLDDAQQALERALSLTPDAESRGQVAWALGRLAGRRGQVDRALEFLGQAEGALGVTAAIVRARGDAYAQVWRWPQAALEFERAAALAPRDVTAWQALAMAQASAGNAKGALFAAQQGLALTPRDADCLRVQALALEQLGAKPGVVSNALEVALHWRTPDEAPGAKARCSRDVPGCAQRRNPVPLFTATP